MQGVGPRSTKRVSVLGGGALAPRVEDPRIALRRFEPILPQLPIFGFLYAADQNASFRRGFFSVSGHVQEKDTLLRDAQHAIVSR